MADSLDLSVIILTYNEELHIERCINSLLPFAKHIFIVDSFSTDNTIAIAQRLGAKVLQNPWVNYAKQFQWGLDHCPIETEWVMRMDADEYVDKLLEQEIITRIPTLSEEITGVCFKLNYKFLGRRIRYGDRNLILLRLWRKNKVLIESRWMDEHITLLSGSSITFDNYMFDENINSISWFIEKHNKYASREMIDILNKKYQLFGTHRVISNLTFQAKIKRFIKERIYNQLPIFVRPTLYFIYRYFLRLGFLDGKEGFAYHFMQGFWYRCLVDLKVLEAERLLKNIKTNPERIAALSDLTGLKL